MLKERHSLGIQCKACSASHLCITRGLNEEEMEQVNKIITKVYVVEHGEHLYHMNDKMDHLLAIYSGCCKDYLIDVDGKEYINNFYLPGDLLGLESIPNKKHLYSAVAITKSEVCLIPIKPLFEKMSLYPKLLQRMVNIMSYKMQNDRHIRITTNAKQRVADFLLNMLRRTEERTSKHTERLPLPMTQFDMSNLLGLAYETVSRILHSFERQGLLEIHNKELYVIDEEGLKDIGSSAETVYGQVDPM